MSDYIISTSSTTDLPESYIKEHGILCLPFSFIISDEQYEDNFGNSMPAPVFYNRLRNGEMSRTSLINADAFEKAFREILESGRDILHIEFSSALSGSLQNARTVAEKLNPLYENKIIVVDSLCASLGLGLLVDYAVRMKEEGKSIDEAAGWVEENKLHIIHWFTVDDLNFLKRGGRVSGVSAVLGTMLKIKPIMDVDDQGRLIPHFKVRGRRKAITGIFEKMKEDILHPEGQRVFISHGDCLKDAEFLAGLIKDEFAIDCVLINYVGPVIGSHSGPGTLALFYYGKQRF